MKLATYDRDGSARLGLVAWPLIGILAGEPLWGLVMGVYAAGVADRWGEL